MELVDGAPYIEEAKGLIREYTEWLGRDLALQGLEEIEPYYGNPMDDVIYFGRDL